MPATNNDSHWPRYVEVAAGMHVPELVQVRDDSGDYVVEVDVVPDAGRLVAQGVRVTRKPGGPAVTGEGLRAVQVASLTRRAIGRLLEVSERDGKQAVTKRRKLHPDDVPRLRENGPTTETLDWVAHLYRLALVTGEPPTKAVETALDIPRSTAGRWVAAARERGLLGPAEGAGRAGG